MTEEEKEQSGQIPPKIKLGNGDDNASEAAPQARAVSRPKSDTSRIDIPRAKAVSGPKSDTSRIDIPKEMLQASADSVRKPIDETMRVVLPKANQTGTGTLRKDTIARPKTIRIKRPPTPSTKTPPFSSAASETVAQAAAVQLPVENTSRIDLSQAQAAPSEKQIEISKEETMLVLLDDAADTGPFGETTDKPPRTIQLQRSGERTPEAETVVDTLDESKSATAKLDLPDTIADTAASGKKTIRIKRAGITPTEGAKKTLKISQPERTEATLSPEVEEHRDAFFTEEPDSPHVIFAVAALFTVIITGVLIYVLCTQMPFGASLPWPGKIVTEWQGPTSMM